MQDYKSRSNSEEWLLKLSIIFTILIASTDLIVGLFSGSFTIVFDGFYSYLDAIITFLSLFVSKLISKDALESNINGRRYFQFGFWHLEPMVLAFNALMLTFGILYALIKSIFTIMSEGHDVIFVQAVIYSMIASVLCFAMGIYENRCNYVIKSDFIALDAKFWIASGVNLAAVFFVFLFGMLLKDSDYNWITPYIDTFVLISTCLFILPSTIRTIKRSLFEVFQVAPLDLDLEVRNALYPIVDRHGFLDAYTYVTKTGRSRIIEIHIIVPLNYPIKGVESLDAIREEIGDVVGGIKEERWLTISFTTQKKWAF
ncbi:cation diffusion facilitator family transporter [Candidatus Liberibacter americanus]|uniref:Co/Zn/Cd cation transporter n=1 Tax=Candidatus Liberibacter americanus str. Sao Paulo TaxID=1261131 RepID=U6B7E8_9HYPH|nr:cation transporter [Candidatus Liberibacter americanus]AHA27781.1 Co/Zn/Cd cation transporter [Candidatus Liberibacter americanus str. Sao Paulo]EMS36166.1 cation diffusion facilitator family transporter [Candidatus Liberibacter americanus PW_SP]